MNERGHQLISERMHNAMRAFVAILVALAFALAAILIVWELWLVWAVFVVIWAYFLLKNYKISKDKDYQERRREIGR